MSYSSPSSHRRPFELDGRFYPGCINIRGELSHRARRRVLCFATNTGVVGASAKFSRAEAYNNAMDAQRGLKPLPPFGTVTHMLLELLKSRGFPVRTPEDAVDDTTGELISNELHSHAHA